ncbi:hypothetical protein R1flu_023703 [Riccia fluitans]|uniref:Inner centromere protein ARK-binding domain-containing protein n=1 Tax=Riccia fluitans TaxID=41844 RepID=A0ABD1XVS3_9MARC
MCLLVGVKRLPKIPADEEEANSVDDEVESVREEEVKSQSDRVFPYQFLDEDAVGEESQMPNRPLWARKQNLTSCLERQQYQGPEDVFGAVRLNELEDIFGGAKIELSEEGCEAVDPPQRKGSGPWMPDIPSVKENINTKLIWVT